MVFATRSDELVHHTTDAVQSSLLRPPGSGSPLCLQRGMLTENTSKHLCVKRARGPLVSMSPLASWPLSGVSVDCASTLESVCASTGHSAWALASRVSPDLTLCT